MDINVEENEGVLPLAKDAKDQTADEEAAVEAPEDIANLLVDAGKWAFPVAKLLFILEADPLTTDLVFSQSRCKELRGCSAMEDDDAPTREWAAGESSRSADDELGAAVEDDAGMEVLVEEVAPLSMLLRCEEEVEEDMEEAACSDLTTGDSVFSSFGFLSSLLLFI